MASQSILGDSAFDWFALKTDRLNPVEVISETDIVNSPYCHAVEVVVMHATTVGVPLKGSGNVTDTVLLCAAYALIPTVPDWKRRSTESYFVHVLSQVVPPFVDL